MSIQKILITAGIILVVIGLLWPLLYKSGLGRLPGDLSVEREGFRFYFPLTTSIIASLALTLLLWLIFRGK